MLTTTLGLLSTSSVHAVDGAGTWSPPIFPETNPDASTDDTFLLDHLGVIAGESDWRAYRGKYRDFVTQDDFLFAVGRQDLAERMRATRRNANVLRYGGLVVALTGVAFLLAYESPGGFDPPPALPLGLCLGGLVGWIVGGTMEIKVATPAEAESFAEQYNRALKAHLEEQTSPTKATVTQRFDVRIVPSLGLRSGSGLSFAVVF